MTHHFYTAFQTQVFNKLCLMLAATLLLNGCGEFAYKRGANVADLENTKKNCMTKSGDTAPIDKCMENSGWVVQKFNEPDPVMEATYNADNRNVTKPVSNAAPVDTESSSSNTKNIKSTVPGNSTSSDKPRQGATQENIQAATITKPQAAPKAADPLDTFKISSWWKMGGSPESMKVAIEECVSTLGETHRPDIKTQDVTRGMLICMRDKGWRGLRAK